MFVPWFDVLNKLALVFFFEFSFTGLRDLGRASRAVIHSMPYYAICMICLFNLAPGSGGSSFPIQGPKNEKTGSTGFDALLMLRFCSCVLYLVGWLVGLVGWLYIVLLLHLIVSVCIWICIYDARPMIVFLDLQATWTGRVTVCTV